MVMPTNGTGSLALRGLQRGIRDVYVIEAAPPRKAPPVRISISEATVL